MSQGNPQLPLVSFLRILFLIHIDLKKQIENHDFNVARDTIFQAVHLDTIDCGCSGPYKPHERNLDILADRAGWTSYLC